MNSSGIIWLIPLILGIGIGGALGWALAIAHSSRTHSSGRDAAATAHAEAAQWRARAEELGARAAVAEERAERDSSILRALVPVRTQLDHVAKRVEEIEQQRSGEHATLREQLRAGALAEQQLLQTTASLASALKSRSSRGMWGEVELARILEASGMMPHVDFTEQRSVGAVVASRSSSQGSDSRTTSRTSSLFSGTARPDVVVHLPGEGYLALDSKAPMDSYLRALEIDENAEDSASRKQKLLSNHAKALRSHIDELVSRRYDRALGSSPELVVLFVPAEAVLAAALEADASLMDYALSRGVALTCPASLMALLRVCATAWARAAVHDDAQELLELGRTLYERLGTVAGHLDALGSALTRSVSSYNKTVASLESRLLVTARSFETLSAPAHPRNIDPDNAQVRRFTSPELTESSED